MAEKNTWHHCPRCEWAESDCRCAVRDAKQWMAMARVMSPETARVVHEACRLMYALVAVIESRDGEDRQ